MSATVTNELGQHILESMEIVDAGEAGPTSLEADLSTLDWGPSSGQTAHFNVGIHDVLARGSVHNDTQSDRKIYALVSFPHITNFDVAFARSDACQRSWARTVSPDPDFPLVLRRSRSAELMLYPGENCELITRVQNAGLLNFSIMLLTEKGVESRQQFEIILYAIYYTALAMILGFFLLVFTTTQNRKLFYYILYCLFLAALVTECENMFPDAYMRFIGEERGRFFHVYASMTWFFFIKFCMNFIGMNVLPKKASQTLQLLSWSLLGIGLWGVVNPWGYAGLAGSIVVLSTVLVVLLTSLTLVKSCRDARLLLAATLSVTVAAILINLEVLGFRSSDFLADHFAVMGSGLEVVLLSFALADQINQLHHFLDERGRSLVEANTRLVQEIKAKEEVQRQLVEEHRIAVENEKLVVMGELSSTIVHEIKNPLLSIQVRNRMQKSILEKEPNNVTAFMQNISRIDAAVEHANRVIASVTRLAQGSESDPFKLEDLREPISESVEMLVPVASIAGVKIDKRLPAEPAFCECRPTQICQVLVHLVSDAIENAKRFADPLVSVKLGEDSEGNWEISVSSASRHESAGLSGNRVELGQAVRDSSVRRAGLGLRIAHAVTKQHGGALTEQSDGLELRFRLVLPPRPRQTSALEGAGT